MSKLIEIDRSIFKEGMEAVSVSKLVEIGQSICKGGGVVGYQK